MLLPAPPVDVSGLVAGIIALVVSGIIIGVLALYCYKSQNKAGRRSGKYVVSSSTCYGSYGSAAHVVSDVTGSTLGF